MKETLPTRNPGICIRTDTGLALDIVHTEPRPNHPVLRRAAARELVRGFLKDLTFSLISVGLCFAAGMMVF